MAMHRMSNQKACFLSDSIWQSTKTSWPEENTWNGKYILRSGLFSTSEADDIHVIEEK